MSIATIKITCLEGATKYASSYEGNASAWISSLDHEDEHVMERLSQDFSNKRILHFPMFFKDMDDTCPYAEMHGPQKEDIERIIVFFQALKKQDRDHHIGVNCMAGISRSTAIGMIGWMIQGYQEEIALDKILLVRSCAWPNERILRFFDEITGKESVRTVKEYKKKA